MNRRKTGKKKYEYDTLEMSPEQKRELVEQSVPHHEKETVPEIPVRKLLAQYEKEQEEKRASANAEKPVSTPPAPAANEDTTPGVPIRVGKDKVLYVEEDRLANRDDSDDTGEIIG